MLSKTFSKFSDSQTLESIFKECAAPCRQFPMLLYLAVPWSNLVQMQRITIKAAVVGALFCGECVPNYSSAYVCMWPSLWLES